MEIWWKQLRLRWKKKSEIYAVVSNFKSIEAKSFPLGTSAQVAELIALTRAFSQFSLVAQSCLTLCDPVNCSTPGLPVHHQLLESIQTHIHWVGDAIQPFHPLSSPFCLPLIFPRIRVFSNESVLRIRWPKYWSFSFSISPSNEYPGLISFRIDWLDFLAVQGTLKSLLQHHSSKASILWCSAFFMVHSQIHIWLLEKHSFD